MNPTPLLLRNHDIHLHSQEFSDGRHPARDVCRFAARWQHPPRYVGLSDHNPKDEATLPSYVKQVRGLRDELYESDGIDLLVGMELEWTPAGPVMNGATLADLDYVLVGYHGMNFSSAEQAEAYFGTVADFEYTDVVAHADRFLGSVDPLLIDWESVFNRFESRMIACEYNLTTPLRAEILAVALEQTGVNFIIGSDTHDFRNIGPRRIVDAWSESLGGGFDEAYEYLINLIRLENSPAQATTLAKLFETSAALHELQRRLYLRSLEGAGSIPLRKREEKLLGLLEKIPECDLDKAFLEQRLQRFGGVAVERITSTLPIEGFRDSIRQGRLLRRNEVSAPGG